MSKFTNFSIIILAIAILIGMFAWGYDTAMKKVEPIAQSCIIDGDQVACNWWRAKFQETSAKNYMREVEKSLSPQPTESQ